MSFFFAEPFFFWGGWRSWKVHPALLSAVNALVVEAWPVARSEVLGEADGAASKAPWGDTFPRAKTASKIRWWGEIPIFNRGIYIDMAIDKYAISSRVIFFLCHVCLLEGSSFFCFCRWFRKTTHIYIYTYIYIYMTLSWSFQLAKCGEVPCLEQKKLESGKSRGNWSWGIGVT